MKKNNKKKKGFTLIELVIVLAVLAIIALIAIPNFNKVRTDSQEKADKQTCETIKRATDMAIANQDMVVKGANVVIEITPGEDSIIQDAEITPATTTADLIWNKKSDYTKSLKEVKKPQQKGITTYKVTITNVDNVESVIVEPKQPSPSSP